MPTLKDIAHSADVSVTTVSLVLSNKGRISKEVRDRVVTVAGDLGYFKKQKKKNERKSNRNVGVLYSFDSHWAHVHRFHSPLILAIEESLNENDFFMSMITFTRNIEPEALYRRIAHNKLAGLISVNFADESLFTRLEKTEVPVVIANNLEFQDLFYTAGVDDFQGTYEAARYLLDLGHRHIAYFDYPDGTFHPGANRRYFGYKAALEEAGVDAINDHRIQIDVHDRERLAEQVSAVLANEPKPTAFMSDDDYLMSSVWYTTTSLGFKIPDDISVIANGDTRDYERADTPLMTTMRINTAQLGKFAAEMMINRLRNRLDEVQVVKLKEQLVDRGSCRRNRCNT